MNPSPESPLYIPGSLTPRPLYARCLVVATVGDRPAAILDAITPWANFKTVVINHGSTHREGAINRPGHKWRNIKLALGNRLVHSIPDFDFVWFPDDDIEISCEDVHSLFLIAHSRKLRLCQPSMAADSQNIGWPVTAHAAGSTFRYTNFVEILAPLFSRESLEICLPTFDENYSGWGLDFIWPKLLGYAGIGVVDVVQMRHLISSSPDWKMPNGKTPREEMDETLARYGMNYETCRANVRNL